MQEKMSFWEKLSYRLGKDPLKPVKGTRSSPLAQAAFTDDTARLDFFAKYCKLDKDKLTTVAADEVSHPKTLKKLQEMGANPTEQMNARILKRVTSRAAYAVKDTLRDVEMLDYLHDNKITLNFKDADGKSFFDKAPDKSAWFKVASPSEIGHEFRQAVADGNLKKVQEMLKNKQVDINASNKNGDTAIGYALGAQDAAMTTFLYEHGANLAVVNKEKQNAFEVASSKTQGALIAACVGKDDLSALTLAAKAGCKFDNPKYMLMTEDKKTLRFLAENGTPVMQAVDDAMNADRREEHGYADAAKRLAFLNSLINSAADKK